MWDFLAPALMLFALRLTDVSFYTMRIMMVVEGQKKLAWVFAFFQASVYILALRLVFTDLGNWIKVLGYASGFATGMVVGMWIEDRLAIGLRHLSIVSPGRGEAIADHLRERGYAVTEVPAQGRDGAVTLLNCDVERKEVKEVTDIVAEVDDRAFITSESLRRAEHGFWGH